MKHIPYSIYMKLTAAVLAVAVLATSVGHCEESRRDDEAISKIDCFAMPAARLAMTQLAPGTRFTGEVRPGARFGKYDILHELAKGGWGKVYLAKDTRSGRLVAIKIISDDFADRRSYIRGFKREGRIQARLRHPSIPEVYKRGSINGRHFISMQYVQGKTLLDIISESGVSFKRALEITEKIADVLDYVHKHGIIHLDIKPNNILLDDKGNVYLYDFGLAETLPKGRRFIETDEILGTPGYLSPDAVRRVVDRRSDVYSLGIVLYRMLAGRRPFEEVDLEEGDLCAMTLHSPLPLPTQFNPLIPKQIEEIVLKALSKNPNDRYQTAGEFADAIRGYLATKAAPFVIAHRGLHTNEIENTIAAFKAAAQAGIPAIEMDVRLTKDGVPVMFHDDALDEKTTGKGRIEDLTWDEVKALRYKNDNTRGIPRLEDVVGEIPGATIFVIELKNSLPNPSRIIEVMERLGVMSRTVFISSELKLLKQVKAHNPYYRAGYILHDPTMQATPEAMGEFQRLADMLKAEKIDILSILANVITPEHVRIIHAAGLHVNAAWDALPDTEVARLKDLGVDSFALDEPVSAHRLLTADQETRHPNRRAIAGSMLAPGSRFDHWSSDRVILNERELVRRFGHKGWGLILAQALSKEMGTFKVPEFDIIEIGELWKPFYKANKKAIDEIIKINRLMRAFRETLIDVYRRYKTKKERRRELNKALNGCELAYLKKLFKVNNLNELEEKLCEDDLMRCGRPLDLCDLDEHLDFSIQSGLNCIRMKILDRGLDFSCSEAVAIQHQGFISRTEPTMYRTSATDEDTKDYANAGRYVSHEEDTWRWEQKLPAARVEDMLHRIISKNLLELTSSDTGLAFILQDNLPAVGIEGGIVFSSLYGYTVLELGQGYSDPESNISPLFMATTGSQSMIIKVESGEVIEVLYNHIDERRNKPNHTVTAKDGREYKITMPEEQLKKVAAVAKDIERRLGYPVDIEFGVKDGTIYIVQIRPVTADPSEWKPLPQFRKEDIVAEFPLAINQGSAKHVKVVFARIRHFEGYWGQYLNKVQRKIRYSKMLICSHGHVELRYPFLYGDRLFWAGKSVCKIGHEAINIRETAGKRNVVMGYFGDMDELKERFGRMQRFFREIFISEEYFDIYSNGDRAVLVKAGAKPVKPHGLKKGGSRRTLAGGA